jgi:predicted ArsR family transcriptional regulator
VTDLPELDSVFHQPVRTRLGVLLSHGPRSFSQLKLELQITDGNLDAHLRKLSAAGYLHSEMIFEGRPRTDYGLSSSGSKAFARYVRDLRRLIAATVTVK